MIKNLLFLVGPDGYRLRQEKKALCQKFREKYPASQIQELTAEDTFSSLQNLVSTPSLFNEKVLILCTEFWNADKFEQAEVADFFTKLEKMSSLVTLLNVSEVPDRRLKFNKFLLKNSRLTEFKYLDKLSTINWTQKYAEKNQGKISRKNAETLLIRCGSQTWTLSREIKKLISAAENGEITTQNILSLTTAKPQIDIWKFTEAMSSANRSKALQCLNDLLAKGESIHYVLSMIFREIRILSLLRFGLDKKLPFKSIISATGLHPFVVSKSLPLAKNFSREKIYYSYKTLLALDKKIKTGMLMLSTYDSRELKMEIEKFIISLCP